MDGGTGVPTSSLTWNALFQQLIKQLFNNMPVTIQPATQEAISQLIYK